MHYVRFYFVLNLFLWFLMSICCHLVDKYLTVLLFTITMGYSFIYQWRNRTVEVAQYQRTSQNILQLINMYFSYTCLSWK